MDESALKQGALAAVSLLAAAARPEDADRLAPVLGHLAGLAGALPPGSLYADWAQPAHPRLLPVVVDGSYTLALAGRAVDGGRAVASASAERHASAAAAGALSEGPAAFWAAPPDAPTSWWQVALGRPLPLALVQLSWRFGGGVRGLPERYTVSTSSDGGATWRAVPGGDVVVDHLPPHALASQAVPLAGAAASADGSTCVTHLRVTCHGYAKSAPPAPDGKSATEGAAASTSDAAAAAAAVKERGHSLGHVALFTRDDASPQVTPGRALHDQLRLAALAALHGRDPGAVAAGLGALSSLSLATGSAQGLLQTALALVAIQKAPPLPRPKQAASRRPGGGGGTGRSLLGGTRAAAAAGGGSDLSDGGGGGGGGANSYYHNTPPTSPLPAPSPTAGVKARAGPGSPLLGASSSAAGADGSTVTVALPPALAALPAPRAALRTSHLSTLAAPPQPLVVDASAAPPAGFDAPTFMRRLASATDEALELLLSAGREEPPPLVPRWDADCKSGNIELSADDTLMTSTTGTKAHVYGTVGFNRGKAAWEFVIEKDSDRDECTCVGAGVKPVLSSQYDTASNLFMVRGYNGRCHAGGTATGTVDKFHPGDTVRFELDCEAGELSMWVNANEQGVVFRGLAGQTVFPAACTYSENRAVAFRRLEAWGQSAGGEGEVAVAALGDMAQGRLGIASTTTTAAAAPVTPAPAGAADASAAAESQPFDFETFAAAAAAGVPGTAAPSAAPLVTPAGGGDVTAATATATAGGQTPLPSTPGASAVPISTPRSAPPPSSSTPLAPARPFTARNEPLLRVRHEGHYVSGGYLDGVPPGARAGAGVSLPSSASLGSPGVGGGNGNGASGVLAQQIVVAGVTCHEGLSLRPDALSGTPALVSFPLTVPLPSASDAGGPAAAGATSGTPLGASTPSAASSAAAPFYEPRKRARPFEWFVGRVGVDDTSWWPTDGGAGAPAAAAAGRLVPVVVSVFADNREVWTSPPLSRPGDSHFCRAYVGGATALTLLARFADQVPQYAAAAAAAAAASSSSSTGAPAAVRRTPTLSSLSGSSVSSSGLSQHPQQHPLDPAAAAVAGSPPHASGGGATGPRVAPKTVWLHACVLQRRSWAWSSSGAHGAPPVFVDNAAAAQQLSQPRHVGSGLPHGTSPRLHAASTASIGSPVAGASSPAPGRPSPMLRAPPSPPAAGGVGPSPRHVPSTLARVRSFDGIALPPPAVGASPHLAPLSLSGSPPASPTVTGSADDTAAVGAPLPTTPGGTRRGVTGRRVAGGGGAGLQLPGPALQSPHAAAQPPVLTAGIAAASSPLALARFILSRLAFLAEARLDTIARGTAAAQRVAKLLGVPLRSAEEASAAAAGVAAGDDRSGGGGGGVSVSTLAALAQERLRVQRLQARATAGKAKSSSLSAGSAPAVDPATLVTAAEVSAIAALASLRAPFCLDVCVATLHTLRQLLAAVLPRVWLETAAACAADAAAAPKVGSDADAARPAAAAYTGVTATDVTATALGAARDASSGGSSFFASGGGGGGLSLFGGSSSAAGGSGGAGLSVFATAGGSGPGGGRLLQGAGLPRPPALAPVTAASAASTPRAGDDTSAAAAGSASSALTRLPPPRVQTDADAEAAAAAPWTAIARATLTLLRCHLRQLVASGADLASIGVLPAALTLLNGDEEAAALDAGGAGGGTSGIVDHTIGRPSEGAAGNDGDDEVSRLRALVAAQALECGDTVTSIGPTTASSSQLTRALLSDPIFTGGATASAAGTASEKRRAAAAAVEEDVASVLSLAPLHRLLQLIVTQDGSAGGDGSDASEDEDAAGPAASTSISRLHAPGASSGKQAAAVTGGRLPPSLQAAAGDAIDAGLHVFYPLPHQRRELLAGLVARGATVELQFRFPAYHPPPPPSARPAAAAGSNGKDGTVTTTAPPAASSPLRDLRWERALLLVQLEAEARGWRCELVGGHRGFVHLLVRMPPAPAQTAAAATGKGTTRRPRPRPKLRPQQQQQLHQQQQQQPLQPDGAVDGESASANGSVAANGTGVQPPAGLTIARVATRPAGNTSGGRKKREGGAVGATTKRQKQQASSSLQPAAADAAAAPLGPGVDFLERGLQTAFARAGLGRWTVPGGCADPPVALSIQRVVASSAALGLATSGSGVDGAPSSVGGGADSTTATAAATAPAAALPPPVGVVRVYPRSTGTFAAVLASVRSAADKRARLPPVGGVPAGARSGGGGGDDAPVGAAPATYATWAPAARTLGAAAATREGSDGSTPASAWRVDQQPPQPREQRPPNAASDGGGGPLSSNHARMVGHFSRLLAALGGEQAQQTALLRAGGGDAPQPQ